MVGIVHPTSRLSGLPELTGVRKVWFSDWYDGPLTGVALYEGREYWFVMVTDDGEGGYWDFEPRVYVLHRLTDEQMAQLWEMHRSFAGSGLRPAMEDLYERWPPEHENSLMTAPAVGWFRDARRDARRDA
jgi:hypothetical protein